MQILRVVRAGLPLAALLALAGCVTLGPADRATLARPEMQPDAYGVDTRIDELLYHTKEAGTGGRLLTPGVCGCK